MSYRGPKVRISRKLGIALTPKAVRVMESKNYPPGQSGAKKANFRSRTSVYKTQLMEKQKLRFQYNVSEKQLTNYFKKSAKMSGNTADILVQWLETRLDAVIFRSGFARTIYAARQYVSHGHINVNGEPVDKPGCPIAIGDTITIRPKSQQLPCFQEALATANPAPSYVEVDRGSFSTTLKYIPIREEVPVICEVPAVIEFYSK